MKKKKKKQYRKQFYWLLAITVADFLIPDPLPVIDELVLTGWTAYLATKVL